MFIKNGRKLNFLLENGAIPSYEAPEGCHFRKSQFLLSLLDKYYIATVCIPNRL